MFERFTETARGVVTQAYRRAVAEGSREIREEHLLAGLFTDPRAASLLAGSGGEEVVLAEIRDARRRGGLSTTDAEALAGLGIDLDSLVDRVESELGAGALDDRAPRRHRGRVRMTNGAKQALASALRTTQVRGDRELGADHLLLGLLAGRGLVVDVLTGHGVTTATVLAALDDAA